MYSRVSRSVDMQSIYLIQSSTNTFGYSTDLGHSFTPVSEKAAFLYTSANFVYVRQQDQSLMVGTSRNNFQKARFPFGDKVNV